MRHQLARISKTFRDMSPETSVLNQPTLLIILEDGRIEASVFDFLMFLAVGIAFCIT
jgi:hypothetical protein